MKIQIIDDAVNCREEIIYKWQSKWVISKPEEATGLLKWRVRFYKAYKVLTWEANAFNYYNK